MKFVEDEGQLALKARDKALISPGSDSSACKTDTNGPGRLIVGADDVMVPLVTQSEKQKRRKNRRTCCRKKGKCRCAVNRRRRRLSRKRRCYRGSDNAYKEFKIVAFYDQRHEHQYAAGTAGDHQALGRLMRCQAAKLKFSQADEKISVSDGAEWIRKQLEAKLPMLDCKILGFYHLSEHIWSAANTCFNQSSHQAKDFAAELLHIAKREDPTALLTRLIDERKKCRSKGKRKSLKGLIQYIARRFEMSDYPEFIKQGWQISSGPTEAFCKTLTARLKGSEMRWDSPNAEAIMALAAMDQSGQWRSYWNLRNATAA